MALAGLVWLGGWQLRTPAVVPASAPLDVFSAERAGLHLEAIASSSRAVGTPGHAWTRQYLYDAMVEMGLETAIQTAASHVRFAGAPGFSAGTVHNVLGRVRGTRSSGAIVVNAHYDSGTTGPGASDCGSCVVTALEAARALLAGEPLRNDVIFVFSDAEEEGDLGAAAFVGRHPWAADVRVAVNYEAQGSSGPAFLYATSPRSGWLVREFLSVAPDATAYSWMRGIMDLYPAGQLECDLAEYMKQGIEGLGFVYVGNSQDYHTIRDDVDRIDLGSVQHEGAYTLALVRRLGEMELTATPPSSDLVYFNVLPGQVANYPASWAIPLAVLATGLVLMVVVIGIRARTLGPTPVLGVAVLASVAVAVAVGSVTLLWIAIRTALPALEVSLVGTYNSGLWIAGLMAMVGAIMTGVVLVLVRRFGARTTAAGAMLAFAPLVWVTAVWIPAMSYAAVWPLLLAVLPLALSAREADWGRWTGWRGVGLLTVGAAPALVLLPATVHQAAALLHRFEGAAGLPVLGLVSLFVAPLALVLVPQIDLVAGPRWRWMVPGASGLIAAACLAAAALASDFDETRPRPDHMSYVLDADEAAAHWVSFDRHLDPWTSAFIPPDRRPASYETVAWGAFRAYFAQAPLVDLAPPAMVVEEDRSEDGQRSVRLRVSSPRGASHLRARIEAADPILSARLDGLPLDLAAYDPAAQGRLVLNYAGVRPAGISLVLTVGGTGPVRVTLEDSSLGFPAGPGIEAPPRPPDTMPSPLYRRDATEVRRRFVL